MPGGLYSPLRRAFAGGADWSARVSPGKLRRARPLRSGRATSPLPRTLFLLLLISGSFSVKAERLPVRSFTTADGLAHERVLRIVQDSRGFLWFCTVDGLSRFDGYRFTTYRAEDGLPDAAVNDLIETKQRIYWIATDKGLVRSNPRQNENPLAHFQVFGLGTEPATSIVRTLHEDSRGQIWIGTEDGLFRLQEQGGQVSFERIDLGPQPPGLEHFTVWAIADAGEEGLWLGTSLGLMQLTCAGRPVRYRFAGINSATNVRAVLRASNGTIWLSLDTDLLAFDPPAETSAAEVQIPADEPLSTRSGIAAASGNDSSFLPPGRALRFGTRAGLNGTEVRALYQTGDGHIWAGTVGGAVEFDGVHFRDYDEAAGLSGNAINTLTEDNAGNLWLGSDTGGAMRIAHNGFVSYFTRDGLGHSWIGSIFEQDTGDLYVLSGQDVINLFDGRRFTNVHVPGRALLSGVFRVALQDHLGAWWIAMPDGLYRFSKVARLSQLRNSAPRIYSTRDGLDPGLIMRLFEDSRGDVWALTRAHGALALAKWQRARQSWQHFTATDDLPPLDTASGFIEDRMGDLWISFGIHGLARFRDGRFEFIADPDGAAFTPMAALHLDASGKLWLFSGAGSLYACDDPTGTAPRFTKVPVPAELGRDTVTCMTSDQSGRLYFGGHRGVYRLNVQTGQLTHYTTAEGLSNNEVYTAFRDRRGALWFGTLDGLSHFTPEPDRTGAPPPILIGTLRIAGVSQPLSDLGETEVAKLELQPNQNQVQADFFGLSFRSGETLRYQYMLAGADRDWGAPTIQRSVTYANLKPGSYRFMVRAVDADGLVSQRPATFAFIVLPPLWERWWFVTLAVMALGAVAFLLYRYRVQQLVAMERIRTRIATDLHDDIGSSLSQVSVLSEVIRCRISPDPAVSEPLTMIAGLSRDLVDSMNDIVWAINPRRDHLSDLTQRMRRFASDVFTAREIEFAFNAPDPRHNIKLGAEMRREVFLIFKESINNMIRHSHCSQADIEFLLKDGWLELKLRDNGQGLDVDKSNEGTGLASMRERAAKLGGALEISSHPGQGTVVKLRVPLARRGWSRK